MSLLDRLSGTQEPRIPAHQFFAALVGLADGQVTRAQVEALFAIPSSGVDKVELDFVVNGYQSAVNKSRYQTALHSIFLLLEHPDYALNKAQIQAWLTAAELPY